MTINLLDAEAQHEAHPDSFEIPSLYERQHVQPGQIVKLAFLATEEGESAERMWVEVLTNDFGGLYTGTLENLPITQDVAPGSLIVFGAEHIIDIDGAVECP